MRHTVKQIVAFENRRYLRDRMTWIGLASFTAVLLIGAVDYWNSLPPRPDGARLFTEASLVLLSLAFHVSIAQDRVPHFDRFLTSNLIAPRSLYFGKLIAATLFLLALTLTAFALALIFSLGDVAYAGKHAVILITSALVLLPIVVGFELIFATRYTVPLILALFLTLTAILNSTGHLPAFLHWMGFDDELTVARAVFRTLAALAVTGALYPVYRRRLGLVR